MPIPTYDFSGSILDYKIQPNLVDKVKHMEYSINVVDSAKYTFSKLQHRKASVKHNRDVIDAYIDYHEKYGISEADDFIVIKRQEEGEKFDDHRAYRYDFDAGIKIVNRIARKVLLYGLPPGVDLLNINIPRHATLYTEIEVTRLARKIFKTGVEERHDPRGRPYYWINGELIRHADEGTDVRAIMENGHISVTPLSLDSTSSVDFSEIENLL